MKLTILGIACFVIAVGFAGNWIYNPSSYDEFSDIEPIPHYPPGDEANYVFHSNITYIPSKDLYYIEYNYVWVNASGHTPDTEEIRIYFHTYCGNGWCRNAVEYVELRIHYEWMEIHDFKTDGNRVNIYFKPVYHTPYTTEESYSSAVVQRAIPIAIPMLLGITLIAYDNRDKFKKLK